MWRISISVTSGVCWLRWSKSAREVSVGLSFFGRCGGIFKTAWRFQCFFPSIFLQLSFCQHLWRWCSSRNSKKNTLMVGQKNRAKGMGQKQVTSWPIGRRSSGRGSCAAGCVSGSTAERRAPNKNTGGERAEKSGDQISRWHYHLKWLIDVNSAWKLYNRCYSNSMQFMNVHID